MQNHRSRRASSALGLRCKSGSMSCRARSMPGCATHMMFIKYPTSCMSDARVKRPSSSVSAVQHLKVTWGTWSAWSAPSRSVRNQSCRTQCKQWQVGHSEVAAALRLIIRSSQCRSGLAPLYVLLRLHSVSVSTNVHAPATPFCLDRLKTLVHAGTLASCSSSPCLYEEHSPSGCLGEQSHCCEGPARPSVLPSQLPSTPLHLQASSGLQEGQG